MSEPDPTDPYAPMRRGFVEETTTAEEIDRMRAVVGPLAASTRELVDAVIRSEVPLEELESVRKEIDQLVERLRAQQLPGSYGVRIDASGRHRAWGNPAVGLRNPLAPPLEVHREADGSAWAETVLGAAYEGPPGMVHGGISALFLDQLVGEAAASAGKPGMTGSLKLRYVAPTPLGPIRFEAKAERVDGIKSIVKGRSLVQGRVCVEAEAIMILPRWARDLEETTGVGDA